MRITSILLIFLLFILNCAGCSVESGVMSQDNLSVSFTLDKNNRYMGFDRLPANYTPEQAVEDGCFTVVGSKEVNSRSLLYGGGERWYEFLAAAEKGEDASLRKVLFLDSTPYFSDLFYVDGEYRYFDCEYSDMTDKPYKYLRKLTGLDGNPQKEQTLYVLTDSTELTYEDVTWSFYSSNLETVTDIMFVWLGFTTYLDNIESSPDLILPADGIYADYTDITPESMTGKGFAVLKNKNDGDSVLSLGSEFYPLGIGFGGCGVCDMKYYPDGDNAYLIFTYSWGSGLHRSHIGIFDLNKKETVFTSNPFMNIDIILSDNADGIYNVYHADIKIGEDFCDLTLTQKEKLAVLTISGVEIHCEVISDSEA
jgi:hypothetical protein